MRAPSKERIQLALEVNPLVEVARAIGMSPWVVYEMECPCGGLLHVNPRMDVFRCDKCGVCGGALTLLGIVKGLDPEAAVRFLEERAGIVVGGRP